MTASSSSGFNPVFTSTSIPRARKISAAWSLRLSEIRTLGMSGSRAGTAVGRPWARSEEHTSELQSLMRISYAVFCLKKKKHINKHHNLQYFDLLSHNDNTLSASILD